MYVKRILIVGGTAGIGHAVALQYLQSGHEVTVVGRNTASFDPLLSRYGNRLLIVRADLSRVRALRELVEQLATQSYDTLLFTSGMLSGKSWLTDDGNEVNYMTNHFSRQYITTGLLSSLSVSKHPAIGYISSIGQYKVPKDIQVFNKQSASGLKTSMWSYIPNDLFFYQLSKKHPNLRIIGFNPGPTKGTALNKRPHAPFLFKIIKPLFQLVAGPVDEIAELLVAKLEAARPGIQFWNKSKAVSAWKTLADDRFYRHIQSVNAQIISS